MTCRNRLNRSDRRRKAFVLVSENVAKELSGLFQTGVPPSRIPPDGSAYAAGGGADALEAGRVAQDLDDLAHLAPDLVDAGHVLEAGRRLDGLHLVLEAGAAGHPEGERRHHHQPEQEEQRAPGLHEVLDVEAAARVAAGY